MSSIVDMSAWWEHCLVYAERWAAYYQEHPSPLSTNGIERNPQRLAISRMAECAAAVACELDPLEAIRWEIGPDSGCDFMAGVLRVEVKSSDGPHLAFPANKVRFFDKYQFDVMLFVQVLDEPQLPHAYKVHGWVFKRWFLVNKKVGAPMRDGGWSVPASSLFPVSLLVLLKGAA